MEQEFTTITDMCRYRAERTPDKYAYIHVDANLREDKITYLELEKRSRRFAEDLRKRGLGQGDRVMLLFPQGLSFVVAFLACGYVGAVPIPVDFPTENSGTEKWERIVRETDTNLILTTEWTADKLKALFQNTPLWVETDIAYEMDMKDDLLSEGDIKANDISFIQYTSGSTDEPKGVILTQKSVISNISRIEHYLNLNEESRFVIWIPHHHNMGLIAILTAMYSGTELVLISPLDFMQNPLIWAKVITKYRNTHTISPNFALRIMQRLLMAHYEECKKTISFESLKTVFVGSEPIDLKSALGFYEAEKLFGADCFNILPGYGLAEATLLVSTYPKGAVQAGWLRVDKQAISENRIEVLDEGLLMDLALDDERLEDGGQYYVGNGFHIPDHQIEIRNSKTLEIQEYGKIGEIFLSGDSLCDGYFGKPELTSQVLFLEEDGRRFLATGDLGFLTEKGELYISGRKKEAIIIRGKNYYPIDIENIIASLDDGFIDNSTVVFQAADEEDRVTVIQEIPSRVMEDFDAAQWTGTIRQAVSKTCGIRVGRVVFVPQYSIPRTANGKIKRSAAAQIDTVGVWHNALELIEDSQDAMTRIPQTKTEQILCVVLEKALEVNAIGIDTNLFEVGGDSLKVFGIVTELKRYGIELSPELLYHHPVVEDLAAFIDSNSLNGGKVENPVLYRVAPQKTECEFPLNGIQTAYLVGRHTDFTLGNVSCHYYAEIETSLSIPLLQQSLNRIIEHQPALRTIILASGMEYVLQEAPEYNIEVEDISVLSDCARELRITEYREETSHRIFEVGIWPFFCLRAFKLSDDTHLICFDIDLMIADATSLFLFCNELLLVYAHGEVFPAFDFHIADYNASLERLRQSDAYIRDKEYWHEKLEDFPEPIRFPLSTDLKSVRKPNFKRLSKVFEHTQWEYLKQAAAQNGVTLASLICCLYCQVLSKACSMEHFAINVTTFNRHDFYPNIENFMGDFTSTVIFDVHIDRYAEFWEQAKIIQRQLASDLSHRMYDGIDFMRDLYIKKGGSQPILVPAVFTCAIQDEGIKGWSDLGSLRYAVSQTPQILLDNQIVAMGWRLHISWDFVENALDPSFVEDNFNDFIARIEATVEEGSRI